MDEEIRKWMKKISEYDPAHHTDSETFRNLVFEGMEISNISLDSIAKYFYLKPETVSSWTKGKITPSPLMKKRVLWYLAANHKPSIKLQFLNQPSVLNPNEKREKEKTWTPRRGYD